jgi:hypothetical protein
MRRYIALIVGLSMTVGGLYFFYTYISNTQVIHSMILAAAGLVIFLGLYLCPCPLKLGHNF